MTVIRKKTKRHLMVFSGRAHPTLAQAVAADLGTYVVPTQAYEFANGEIYVRYEESVRGCDAFVIQSHTVPINEWIMEQLIMVDALKRASAKRITVVLPFYGYARQDKKHRGREPISARLMADLFKHGGRRPAHGHRPAHRPDPGLLRRAGRPPHGAADARRPCHRATTARRSSRSSRRTPGRIKVAEQWSARLGGAPLAFVHKTRDITRPNESVANRVVGDVAGRVCILVDDMIDTGGTITKAADAIMAEGAAGVVVAATHAILSGPASTGCGPRAPARSSSPTPCRSRSRSSSTS
jgi:ribose-phosphate pyrophosphokinase